MSTDFKNPHPPLRIMAIFEIFHPPIYEGGGGGARFSLVGAWPPIPQFLSKTPPPWGAPPI